jgi:predicted phosphodiesterase
MYKSILQLDLKEMVRFQLCSDIHLEFYGNKIQTLLSKFPVTGDYLLLAGDIGYPQKSYYRDFLQFISPKYKKVFLVAGNHEYYQQWAGWKPSSISMIQSKLSELVAEFSNIHYLDNSYIDISDTNHSGEQTQIRVLGTTLWFRPENDEKAISDYHTIYIDHEGYSIPITNDYIEAEWNRARTFIRENVDPTKKNIVMTHHLPTYQLVRPEYLIDRYKNINSYFASNCEDLIQPPITTWVCGHSHGFSEKVVNGVPCVVNAFGYPKEAERLQTDMGYSFDL